MFLGVVLLSTFVVRPSTVFGYYTNMPAANVLGQSNFTSSGSLLTEKSLLSPQDAVEIRGKLIIVDQVTRHRVLIWNSIPTSPNVPADIVLGQPNFSSNIANNGGRSSRSLDNPTGVATDGTRLFVADRNNSRILVWNEVPNQNFASANMVIGQPDFSSGLLNQGNAFPSANTMNRPEGVTVSENRMFVADSSNNRVLVFNHIPTTMNASADVVLGQPDFISSAANNGGLGPTSMTYPIKLAVERSVLAVSDWTNNRVLFWNQIPISINQPPTFVLGQNDFSSGNANKGGIPTASTLSGPTGITICSGRIYVADWSNQRVLIFNSLPSRNDPTADIVLGQPTFFSVTAGTSATSLNGPTQALIIENSLYVTEEGNHRVLIFNNALPDVSLSRTVTGQPNGSLRFSGTASTNVTNEIVKQIEYSVNGHTWTGGFPTDGKFDSASEQYYFDFDPKVNEMADQQGYTVKIRSSHGNDIDTSKATLFFEPFVANSPDNNTFTLNRLPTFNFTIQKVRFADLKENLDHFRIMIFTDPPSSETPARQSWTSYIDNIPVDYESVRQHSDNLRPNPVDTMNGIYEDKFKTVQYDQDNSVITVTQKSVDSFGNFLDKDINNGGKQLANGTYYWRVEVEDHAGQIQYTDPKVLRIGTRQVVTSRKFFPITITGIGGKNGAFNLSTENQNSNSEALNPISLTTRWPTFAGIAMAGTTVTFSLKDTSCNKVGPFERSDLPSCVKTYDTVIKPDSTFRKTIPKALKVGETYEVTVSVKDTGDNYNELSPFQITIGS